MRERIRKVFDAKLASKKLNRITGIPQGRFMYGSNDPDLGGGGIFTLGHFSDRSTCVSVSPDYYFYLWGEENGQEMWLKAGDKDLRAWSVKTLEATKSQLVQHTVEYMRNNTHTN